MNLNVMKFKNYVWPHNPSTINISVKRDLKEVFIPFKGSIIQDYGREKRIVSGSGQFFGNDCIEQFDSLFFVFKQGFFVVFFNVWVVKRIEVFFNCCKSVEH